MKKGGKVSYFATRKACVAMILLILFVCICDRGVIAMGTWFQQGKDVVQKGQDWYQKGKETYEQAKDVAGRVIGIISPAIASAIKSQEAAIINNSYKNMVAQVRVGNELNIGEKIYCRNREPKVRVALERMLGRSLEGKRTPTIAFVCSGGGYRAMLCTTGSMCGASKLGLIDATTYIAALSGSTWAIGSWYATGRSIVDFKSYIAACASKSLKDVTANEMRLIMDAFLVKMAYGQPFTLVDLYGVLLGNRLLTQMGDNKFMTYLSSQADYIATADWPYPIYTAVDGREAVSLTPPWYEFTPHEIGSASFATYVPTWAYGRTFMAGRSIDNAPEQSLAYHFGTWGSAFAAHAGKIWEELIETMSDPIVTPFIEQTFIRPMQGKRPLPFWSEIYNYMFAMSGQELYGRELLKLVDGGLDFNLPYPPVSGIRPERKADVIIFLDASKTVPHELKKTEQYARCNNVPFPKIDYTGLDKKTIAVFRDEEDKSAPVVIYMPRVTDVQLWDQNAFREEFNGFAVKGFDLGQCAISSFCDTANFKYSLAESKSVMDTTEFNMIANKDIIFEAINWAIDNR